MLGRLLVLSALAFSVYGAGASLAAAGRRDGLLVVVRPDLLDSARRAIRAAAACVAGAAAVLWWALFSRDFGLDYVASHSSRATPPWYTFSAFWAGMDGSMLLWCLVLSIYAAVFVRRGTQREPLVPLAIPVIGATLAFFTAMTATLTDPFRPVEVAVIDGRGLNPLLQSPAMVIHPPMLYFGFVGLLIPLALVVSALVSGRASHTWIGIVRRWMLLPWLLLGAGMVLGGAWAYTELGWGGYWAWDPVENAALMPWLAATAFLHSAVVQERRGMLKVWNVTLVLAAADLAVFGTFLTRSGLLSSVHTFTESPLGAWFFGLLAVQTLAGLAILAWKLPALRAERRLDAVVSRESGFLLNNVLFVSATVVVLWGTLLPLMSEALLGREIAVGPPFFNRVMAPLGALLLLLAAVGPVVPWRRASAGEVARRLRRPAVLAAATAMPAAFTGRPAFFAVCLAAALTGWVAVLELWRSARRAASEEAASSRGAWSALRRAAGRLALNPRRSGGYLVHLGIAVMIVGFAGSLFRTQADVLASPGETFVFAGYDVRYEDMVRRSSPDRDVRMAVLTVLRDGRELAVLRPQQNVHLNFDQAQSEIAIRTTPREDLYVILTGTRDASDEATFRLYANPLVFFVWAGAAVSVAGGVVAMLAGRRRTRAGQPGSEVPPRKVAATSTS